MEYDFQEIPKSRIATVFTCKKMGNVVVTSFGMIGRIMGGS